MKWAAPTEYAIRALVRLAGASAHSRTKLQDLAGPEKIPTAYLAKVLLQLVNARILTSTKGPHGGYALARPPARITLLDIRHAVETVVDDGACALGYSKCSDETACPLHDRWKPIREEMDRFMRETSLQVMSEALAQKMSARQRAKTVKPTSARRSDAV